MNEDQFESLKAMFESNNQEDQDLAEEIFCNMNITEVSWFITYWGKQGKSWLPQKSYQHVVDLHHKK